MEFILFLSEDTIILFFFFLNINLSLYSLNIHNPGIIHFPNNYAGTSKGRIFGVNRNDIRRFGSN